ncbi:threonine--tRNA ligase [Candidatus Shikimatogenerans silvanidophilus]|uniref:threonine--tRNA ligase n=1 Tax=Candidatus Shikimatogenerans silvanidophilus TaxID=2782547 RepID=UPI001BA8558A|nr:threonine--tRNA ligase [Candidatus Shikimatogenerans silvanidophilus]
MIYIKFPNGKKKLYKKGITIIKIIKDIKKDIKYFYKNPILYVSINGVQVELYKKIYENVENINFYTWKDELGKKAFWHSSSHLLAQSILFFYPNVKISIGPSTKYGFYYDIDFLDKKFIKKDFEKIEKKIIEIANKEYDFFVYEVSKEKAIEKFKNNIYKKELIENIIKKNSKITFCTHGDFTDLCKGGHINNTKFIKFVKILNVSKSYWKGEKKNKQLTRISAISFPNKIEMKNYFFKIKELKKRNHKKIGKNLGLFTFSTSVGKGLPIWLPNGTILYNKLKNILIKIQEKKNYRRVITPHIGKKKLYEQSGHWTKYSENNFKPIFTPEEKESFLLKPMNCPHHCEIYRFYKFSYKDLPIKYYEFGTVYRYEKSGEINGLIRSRSFTQDDAHIFCREDQILSEFKDIINLIIKIFKLFSFKKYELRISLRDKKKLKNYIGTEEIWKKSEECIINAVKNINIPIKFKYGEAAFYGPKLDFIIEDIFNRKWQMGTIQIDYNLPNRFNLNYLGKDNKFHKPVLIHRALFGSLERFIALLLEHNNGLPIYLQKYLVCILPIKKKYLLYSKRILNLLINKKIVSYIDEKEDHINNKIKKYEKKKIPFIIVIGEKEENNNTVSVRQQKKGYIGTFLIYDFINFIKKELEIFKNFD